MSSRKGGGLSSAERDAMLSHISARGGARRPVATEQRKALSGEYGSGKTVTAVRVARRAIDAFPDGRPSAYRIVDPAKYILTATFDL